MCTDPILNTASGVSVRSALKICAQSWTDGLCGRPLWRFRSNSSLLCRVRRWSSQIPLVVAAARLDDSACVRVEQNAQSAIVVEDLASVWQPHIPGKRHPRPPRGRSARDSKHLRGLGHSPTVE